MSTSQTLGDCCISGHIHQGEQKGHVVKIAGLDTYETLPPSGDKSKTVLFVTDIFGYELPNVRLLADEFAAAGFYCVIPDILDGDPISHDYLNTIVPRDPDSVTTAQAALNGAKTTAVFGAFLVKHREAVVRPKLDAFVKELNSTPGVKKIGAIGFCWGARYAILLAGELPAVEAVVANHPTLVAVPAEIEALRKPTQINIGDKDAMVDVKGIQQIKEVLSGKPDVPSEVNVFPGAVHGFTVRGDTETPVERERKEEAAKNAINWFNKHLV